jgi:hypothetical protein
MSGFQVFYHFCNCLPSILISSGSSYDISNLADVADVFVANSISQSVASDVTLKSFSLVRTLQISDSESYLALSDLRRLVSLDS